MTGELISRETAIQTVHDTMYQFIDDSEIMTGRDGLLLKVNKAICNGLKEIPSVENKGEWIYQQGIAPYKWRCNKCEKMFKTDFNYCPNCGADMRGEK